MTTPDEPPIDRFCDLVMKGGITSGLVYPKAIELLSHKYHFKSIGGTSAGAITAAITAAAEYQRCKKDGSRAGFDLLKNLPEKLGEKLPGTDRSKLLSLFQPQPRTRRLFSILIGSLNNSGSWSRIFAILGGLLRAYWPATLISIFGAWLTVATGHGVLAAILLLVIALCILIGLWVYRDVTQSVVANGYGLCTGLTSEKGQEALTPWLHKQIQKAAGLNTEDPPLTFGMLWNARELPLWIKVPKDAVKRSIDLQMFSTNLGHGRPYIFPQRSRENDYLSTRFRDRDRLFFRPDELANYLPKEVLDCMTAHAKPYKLEPGRKGLDPSEEAADGLLELPEPENFPVLLAARMSLSFPFLFAAVPLWAIDYDALPEKRKFRCCWFSDGGISSNFPMHLFDGLVPLWPTFGINLEPKLDRPDMVFLPKKYTHGHGERWNCFAEASNPASRFGGFISSILNTMQNWNDNTLARMPGVRDRIARVRLYDTEGGLNLNMNLETILKIAQRGEDAALELMARYAPQSSSSPQAEGWDEQRWVRLGVLIKMIEARAPGVLNALDPLCPHVTSYAQLIKRAAQPNAPPPAGYENPLTPAQAQALNQVLQALDSLVTTMSTPHLASAFKPMPNPELRVRPPL